MRIYISCDAEGIGGIADWEQCGRGQLDYKIGRELMTHEVNAAIDGALSAGAKEIVVSDSHEKMVNLLPEELNPQALLIQGPNKSMSMVTGLNDSFDAAMFIGYHSSAGTQNGIMSHTYTSILTEIKINGTPVGEAELNGYLAGYYAVPLVFLSGDEAATREITRFVPNIVTVASKKGLGRRASMSMHPAKVREMIKTEAERAVRMRKQIKPLKARKPVKLEVNFWKVESCDLVSVIPGVIRKDSRRVEYTHTDYRSVYGMFLTIMRIAGCAKD